MICLCGKQPIWECTEVLIVSVDAIHNRISALKFNVCDLQSIPYVEWCIFLVIWIFLKRKGVVWVESTVQ